MAKNEFFNFFDNNLAKNLTGFAFPLDMQAMMESQAKNLQAITEAQQLALEGLQSVALKQSALVSTIVQDNLSLAQESWSEASPEQKIAKQADMAKKIYDRSIKNIREIGDTITKSNQDAAEILTKRISASLNEVKAAATKTTAKKAA